MVGRERDEGTRRYGAGVDEGDGFGLAVEDGVSDGERGIEGTAGGVDFKDDGFDTRVFCVVHDARDKSRYAAFDCAVDFGDVYFFCPGGQTDSKDEYEECEYGFHQSGPFWRVFS